MRPIARIGAFLLSITLCGPALAQTPPLRDPGRDPGLESQRQRDLNERREAVEDFTPGFTPQAPGPAQERFGPCFQINSVNVDGTSVIPADQIAKIIAPFVPGCLQGADIQAIMRGIDGAYAEAGYITSKTYIPQQNIASGALQLSVIEGRSEGLFLVDADGLNETPRGARQLKTAFPGVLGRVFKLQDYEQGLDQMNRLKSVEAKLRLQPGQEPGGSDVIIQRVQKDRVRGYVTLDNQGSDSTGTNRLLLDLEADDLFGLNDALTFGYDGSENTNAFDLSLSIPYGYTTLSLSSTYSEFLTPLTDIAELFGTTRTHRVDATYLARRNQTSTLTFNGAIEARHSKRFVNDAELTPQNLAVLELGARRIKQNGPARTSLDATASFGLNAFGADRDAQNLPETFPRAQFFKLEGGWYRQAPLGKIGVMINDLRLQYSNDPLFGAEQMVLGSYSTIRGYETSEAFGDTGAYMRNDIYFDKALFGASEGFFSELQQQAFFDVGVTYDNARHQNGTAASLGYGLSWQKGRVFAEALLAVPLIKDREFDPGDVVLWFQLNVKSF